MSDVYICHDAGTLPAAVTLPLSEKDKKQLTVHTPCGTEVRAEHPQTLRDRGLAALHPHTSQDLCPVRLKGQAGTGQSTLPLLTQMNESYTAKWGVGWRSGPKDKKDLLPASPFAPIPLLPCVSTTMSYILKTATASPCNIFMGL